LPNFFKYEKFTMGIECNNQIVFAENMSSIFEQLLLQKISLSY